MIKIYAPLPLHTDGSIDVEAWVQDLPLKRESLKIVRDACQLASFIGEDRMTRYGISFLAKSLEVAEILAKLQFDSESIAASIIYVVSKGIELKTDDIEAQLGRNVAQLVKNVRLLEVMTQLRQKQYSQQQINNIRKMLLAMVRDVRVVVIRLAEHLCVARRLRGEESSIALTVARETMDIFAPLANRLGLHRIKWELEDLAFFYLEPDAYKEIARHLAEKRCNREKRVDYIIELLTELLKAAGISAEIYGRAKHIYSIKRKMQRKNVDLSQIYDAIAVRILVQTVQDCYATLSIVQEYFQSIPEEFDDYIATPKSNGYQSIHLALLNENHKTFEVQIRTHQMHKLSEQGVAAHWMYKEGKQEKSSYEQKIAWLRNLLEWQKELTRDRSLPAQLEKDLFEDRVYVFTPLGDIIDLINGATPLDFAYCIHTDLGHRCHGAKVNRKIVPLTYQLKTGDQVEILTSNRNKPSRDWLLLQRGYLKTSTARVKVLQWFKQQDYSRHITEGKALLERELQRLNIINVNFGDIAIKLQFKSTEMMFAALGRGDLRLSQVLSVIHSKFEPHLFKSREEEIVVKKVLKQLKDKGNVTIFGVEHLLSHIARCCKPIPGDPIVGYITQTRGVAIHHKDCKNIFHTRSDHKNRLVEVEWQDQSKENYFVDIEVLAYKRHGLIRDINMVLSNNKIDITNFNTFFNKSRNESKIVLTVVLSDIELLSKILDHISQIPNVSEVKRIKSKG